MEKFAFFGDLKKRFFNDRKNLLFVATYKSHFSAYEKIVFSWRPEEAVFRKPKKSRICGDLKK